MSKVRSAIQKKLKELDTSATRSQADTYIGKSQVKNAKNDFDFKKLKPDTKQHVVKSLEAGEEINLEETHDDFYPQDFEGGMAKSQLISIVKNARELYNMMDEKTQLEGWVQSKITIAEDYLQALVTYLQGEQIQRASGDVNINENKKKAK